MFKLLFRKTSFCSFVNIETMNIFSPDAKMTKILVNKPNLFVLLLLKQLVQKTYFNHTLLINIMDLIMYN